MKGLIHIMYKKSDYNIEVDSLENGDILLYNTLKTSFGIMDVETKEIYNRIEELSSDEIENLKENKNFNTLLNFGYIIPKNLKELDILKLNSQTSKFLSRSLALTIAPTLNCNMACPYCYENKGDIKMEENVKIVLFDFVKNYLETNACLSFQVTWYGGEPLLEVDTIVDLSTKFIELCKEKKIQYNASIVTNGVLLTRDVALLLKDCCNIDRVQITIDGLPEYHNKRRILVDGRDSFNIIVDNIENCKDLLEIAVRVNVDKLNMDNIEALSDYLIDKKGWIDNPYVHLAPVEKYNDNCYLKGDECLNAEEFAELDNKLLDKLYKVNSRVMKAMLYPQVKGNYCGAVQHGVFVVDPEGDLYTCWNVIGFKERKVGNIIQNNPMNIEYIKWLTHEPSGKCLSCSLLPICLGGCPHEFFSHGEPRCEKRIQNYKDKLKFAYNDYAIKKYNV